MRFELDDPIDWERVDDELDLHQMLRWTALDALASLPGLRRLRIERAEAIRDWSPLARLQLDELRLVDHWENLADLSFLDGLDLRVLELSGSHQLTDLRPIARQRSLHELDLSDCWALRDLRPLAGSACRELRLFRCKLLADLRPLGTAPIEALTLEASPAIWDLRPLARHPTLRRLDLRSCAIAADTVGPMDLRELTIDELPLSVVEAPRLEVLAYSAPKVDLAPLAGHASLRTLVISGALPRPAQLLDLPALTDLRWLGGPLEASVDAELRRRGCSVLVL